MPDFVPPLVRRLIFGALAVCLAAPLAAQRHRNLDVLINPARTQIGRQVAPADPDLNPITYRLLTRGFVEFDDIMPGLEPPERDALLQHLVVALRERGYVPAEADAVPRLAIAITWGSIFVPTRETLFLRDRTSHGGYSRDRNRNKDELHGAQVALEFLGLPFLPLRWGPNHDVWWGMLELWPRASTGTQDRIARICTADTFVLAVTAYDYRNIAAGREVAVWQTRALAPARGIGAEEAMHRMLMASAAFFGRDEAEPVRARARKQEAPVALHFGIPVDQPLPPPADLTTLIAHDYGNATP